MSCRRGRRSNHGGPTTPGTRTRSLWPAGASSARNLQIYNVKLDAIRESEHQRNTARNLQIYNVKLDDAIPEESDRRTPEAVNTKTVGRSSEWSAAIAQVLVETSALDTCIKTGREGWCERGQIGGEVLTAGGRVEDGALVEPDADLVPLELPLLLHVQRERRVEPRIRPPQLHGPRGTAVRPEVGAPREVATGAAQHGLDGAQPDSERQEVQHQFPIGVAVGGVHGKLDALRGELSARELIGERSDGVAGIGERITERKNSRVAALGGGAAWAGDARCKTETKQSRAPHPRSPIILDDAICEVPVK